MLGSASSWSQLCGEERLKRRERCFGTLRASWRVKPLGSAVAVKHVATEKQSLKAAAPERRPVDSDVMC